MSILTTSLGLRGNVGEVHRSSRLVTLIGVELGAGALSKVTERIIMLNAVCHYYYDV